MNRVLTEYGLRLTYLCDPRDIRELSEDRILQDLADHSPDSDPLPWLTRYRLTDYDHVILATDRSTGAYLALLGANDSATKREQFLLLETAFVATIARGQHAMRRMLALAMLRIGGMGSVPSIIATCTRNPICYRAMRDFARRFTGAVFFPNPGSVTIDFEAATLAQRIAREIGPNHRFQAATGTIRSSMMIATGTDDYQPLSHDPQIDLLFGQHMQPTDQMLAVLDFRKMDDAVILDDARRIYRSR
jgi:hypothetical protein